MLDPASGLPVGRDTVRLAAGPLVLLAPFGVAAGTLVEELWFRGMVQHKLARVRALGRWNPHLAIAVQAGLFGLVHYLAVRGAGGLGPAAELYFLLYPAAVGVVIGYLNYRHRSLWPGWIVHATNNLLAAALLAALARLG